MGDVIKSHVRKSRIKNGTDSEEKFLCSYVQLFFAFF